MKKVSNISIKLVPIDSQRYDTQGDYWIDTKGVMQVRITASTEQEFFMILIHELIEAFLAKFEGIKWEDIDKFDIAFENPFSEPGDDRNAPYYSQHQLATVVEKLLACRLNVNWQDYIQS